MGKWGKQPCEVFEVEPERVIKYRFAAGALNTTITWQLIPKGPGTRLTLTHEGFDLDSPVGRQAFESMNPGWPDVLGRLEAVLRSEPPGSCRAED